jgi:hypothetical protein
MVLDGQEGRVWCEPLRIVEPRWLRIAAGKKRVDEEPDPESVAVELARVRDAARAEARREAAASAATSYRTGLLAPPPEVRGEAAVAPVSPPVPAPFADPPSARAVNDLWRAEPARRGALSRLLERLLGPRLSAQREWNAAQVRLDNEMLRWLEARLAATHAHYDLILGRLGRRLDEADARHRRLEQELVVHVRELLRRFDLLAADASRGRAGLELQVEDLRARLEHLARTLERRP